MWQPTEWVLESALAHATVEMPREACGVVVDGKFRPVPNESTVMDHFAMQREGFFRAVRDGKLEAIVHSHAYQPPIASQADLSMCETTNVPWLIVSVPTGKWTVIEPHGYVAPLIGRQWCHGSLDCWGLVRDGFTAFTGIELVDFDRDWDWWHKDQNLIVEKIESAGFKLLPQDTPPQHCDMIIMQIRAPVPNHMGLYIEPEGMLLHQLSGRVSVRETYGGFYQQATMYIARHLDFLAGQPPRHDPSDRRVWTGEIAGREPS
jgi:proteasome lid subunit RPN8/RPN11